MRHPKVDQCHIWHDQMQNQWANGEADEYQGCISAARGLDESNTVAFRVHGQEQDSCNPLAADIKYEGKGRKTD